PQAVDLRIVGRTLGPAVPAFIVIGAVAVIFQISLVMLVVVGDQVIHSKTVMAGDESNTGMRTPAIPFIQGARTADPRRHFRGDTAIAPPESADAVAVQTIPFRPQDRKIADLITTFA